MKLFLNNLPISSVLTSPFQGRSFLSFLPSSITCLLKNKNMKPFSFSLSLNPTKDKAHLSSPTQAASLLEGSTVFPSLLPLPHPFQSPNFPIYEQGFWKMMWQNQAFPFPHSQHFQKWDLFNPLWIQFRMNTSFANSLISPAQGTLAIHLHTLGGKMCLLFICLVC